MIMVLSILTACFSLKFVKVYMNLCIYYLYLPMWSKGYICLENHFIQRNEIIQVWYYLYTILLNCVPIPKQISGANDLKNDLSFWWTWVLRGDHYNRCCTVNPGKSLTFSICPQGCKRLSSSSCLEIMHTSV